MTTIFSILQKQAERQPEAPALAAPDRNDLSYAQLVAQIECTAQNLKGFGIERNDRVAIVLPNGPEMATAFLSVASCATAAPLNPAYSKEEFNFYLSDLDSKALIVPAESDLPSMDTVREVARSRNILIIELVADTAENAGVFSLCSTSASTSVSSQATSSTRSDEQGFAQSDDVALVLHTSGTTSRPKIVPLTQRNLCASARNIASTLQLTPDDRCLNVMPLFHIHGLVAATLASLASGASVCCTPGFYAPRFFEWMQNFRPTWYTAVPTMHQAIVARAQGDEAARNVIAQNPLRFVRSSSAALPPPVMRDLEEVFGAPAIEAYGMTEAAHQMASNPLPPRARKAGSVGLAAGPEIAIMNEQGDLLACNTTGEIVIRGENVTPGYDRNEAANAAAFANGWFRTGDQGFLDEEGYLFISGRLKEIINRGGEKISPREIDEVLLSHPSVAQAVAFAIPHPQLGEDVAAIVVLRLDTQISERELREYSSQRLAHFKVPSLLLFRDEIPKGATGKLQRIGLAEKLGLTPEEVARLTRQKSVEDVPYLAPRTPNERTLVAIWKDVLGKECIGVHDHFFALGGDSMLATQTVARIRRIWPTDMTLMQFFEMPTVAQLAELITTQIASQDDDIERLLAEIEELSDEEAAQRME